MWEERKEERIITRVSDEDEKKVGSNTGNSLKCSLSEL